MEMDADISVCGLFRWSLLRRWDEKLSMLGLCMINPSKADAKINDRTVSKCIHFGKLWGFGGLIVANAFALRSTDPQELYRVVDPIGPENDVKIVAAMKQCSMVIAAWGVHGAYRDRGNKVCELLIANGMKMHCLGTSKHGHPKHPLYLKNSTLPIVYRECA